MRDEPKPINGYALAEALFEAGIVRRDELVSRLVIDIPTNSPVRIFVERLGDERLLSVTSSLEGVQIIGAAGAGASCD